MSKEVTGQRERGLGFGSNTTDPHYSYFYFLEYLFIYVLYAYRTISRDCTWYLLCLFFYNFHWEVGPWSSSSCLARSETLNLTFLNGDYHSLGIWRKIFKCLKKLGFFFPQGKSLLGKELEVHGRT